MSSTSARRSAPAASEQYGELLLAVWTFDAPSSGSHSPVVEIAEAFAEAFAGTWPQALAEAFA